MPGGDEPHYLVITQSLLYDGDLKIENNHQRGDYRAYYGGDLPPHVDHGAAATAQIMLDPRARPAWRSCCRPSPSAAIAASSSS